MDYEIKVLSHIKWNSSYMDYKNLLDSVKEWTLVLFKSPYFETNNWLFMRWNWVMIEWEIIDDEIDKIKEKYWLLKIEISIFTNIDNYLNFKKTYAR